MIMHKISYIICKKYKCPHGQTGKVAWFRPKSSPSSNLGVGTKLKLKYGS